MTDALPYVVARVDAAVGTMHRAGLLTRYLAEEILDDARRARPGARLELTLPHPPADAAAGRLLDRLADVTARGVQVIVRRGA